MTAVINGSSPTLTFSDGTTQATSAIVSGYVPYANLPAGSVLQVVSVANSTSQSTTNTSFTNTSLAASITPKSATNKILIIVNFAGYDAGGAGADWFATIRRGTTNLGSATFGLGTIFNTAGGLQGAFGISYLDSPATTSSTTYSFAYAKGGGTAYLNFNGETSTITLLEIAA